MSIVVFVVMYVQFFAFGTIAEKMTTRLRYALFRALLRQDVGYFDLKENNVGALTSKLSTDAALVKASLADRTALLVQNLFTVAVGLGIAFYYVRFFASFWEAPSTPFCTVSLKRLTHPQMPHITKPPHETNRAGSSRWC